MDAPYSPLVDDDYAKPARSAEEAAGPLSCLLMSWLDPTIDTGFRRRLETSDSLPLSARDRSTGGEPDSFQHGRIKQ